MEADKDWMMIRIVGGWVFLLVMAHPGSPGQRAVKWLLLWLWGSLTQISRVRSPKCWPSGFMEPESSGSQCDYWNYLWSTKTAKNGWSFSISRRSSRWKWTTASSRREFFKRNILWWQEAALVLEYDNLGILQSYHTVSESLSTITDYKVN